MNTAATMAINPGSTQRLAIVIPAYKPDFLDETLRSIAAQTCKEFTVYVGDDASPHDLRAICERWQGTMDLRYHRFEQNLGARNLVAQWSRCIALSHEPWISLFSDDDLLDSGCVAAFYAQLDSDEKPCSLFHFNVSVIDGKGKLIKEAPEFPPVLSAREFAVKRFSSGLLSYAPDYIFSREAFVRKGGFQSFPRAWCSDDATWIKLAGKSGIRTIAGPKVKWRFSGQNISSSHIHDRFEKIEAAIRYIEWLHDHFRSLAAAESGISSQQILLSGRWWFFSQAEDMKIYFCKTGLWRTARRLQKIYGEPLAIEVIKILLQDFRVLRKGLSRRNRMS